jgi:thiamine-phosphate pyrophosphorylase
VSDSLAPRGLARAAARLNRAGRFAGLLPPLCFVTDDDRLADAAEAAKALPRGSLVIARASGDGQRAALVQRLAPVAKARDLMLLMASDATLAAHAQADGLHLPEARAGEIAHWRALRPDWMITSSAHSFYALMRAQTADAVLLSPVFATASHPDRNHLTAIRANAIAAQAHVPIYALGGVDAVTAKRLAGFNYAGVAAISALQT